jgi:1-deoxy-D-xylulose-5-phosphate reductoisomerase
LGFPQRLKNNYERFDFLKYPNLSFEQPDMKTFRNLAFAYSALEKGGNTACILNAANEVAVDAFLKDKISFLGMSDLIEHCIENVRFIPKPTLEDYIETDQYTRALAQEKV